MDYLSDWQAADKSYKDAALANKPTEAELRQNIWKMLVKNEVVKQEASKNNIVVGVQEINDEYSNLVKTVGSEDQAKQLIENNYNWSIEQFKERIMRPYVLQQKLAASKEMLDKLNKEPEARANEVLRQAQEGKKSFEDLAKEFGEDGTKDKGGDLGWFGKDMMIKEFEDAVASMQVGEIKGLVKTSFGFHLIKLVDKRKNDKKETEWRAEHILIKTGDFDSYLNNLVTKAKVWKWISL